MAASAISARRDMRQPLTVANSTSVEYTTGVENGEGSHHESDRHWRRDRRAGVRTGFDAAWLAPWGPRRRPGVRRGRRGAGPVGERPWGAGRAGGGVGGPQ